MIQIRSLSGFLRKINYFFSKWARILIKGTASEVAGMVSDTLFRNTVNERSIVTSAKRTQWTLKLNSDLSIFSPFLLFCSWSRVEKDSGSVLTHVHSLSNRCYSICEGTFYIPKIISFYAKSGLRFALGSTGEAKMGQAIVITN